MTSEIWVIEHRLFFDGKWDEWVFEEARAQKIPDSRVDGWNERNPDIQYRVRKFVAVVTSDGE